MGTSTQPAPEAPAATSLLALAPSTSAEATPTATPEPSPLASTAKARDDATLKNEPTARVDANGNTATGGPGFTTTVVDTSQGFETTTSLAPTFFSSSSPSQTLSTTSPSLSASSSSFLPSRTSTATYSKTSVAISTTSTDDTEDANSSILNNSAQSSNSSSTNLSMPVIALIIGLPTVLLSLSIVAVILVRRRMARKAAGDAPRPGGDDSERLLDEGGHPKPPAALAAFSIANVPEGGRRGAGMGTGATRPVRLDGDDDGLGEGIGVGTRDIDAGAGSGAGGTRNRAPNYGEYGYVVGGYGEEEGDDGDGDESVMSRLILPGPVGTDSGQVGGSVRMSVSGSDGGSVALARRATRGVPESVARSLGDQEDDAASDTVSLLLLPGPAGTESTVIGSGTGAVSGGVVAGAGAPAPRTVPATLPAHRPGPRMDSAQPKEARAAATRADSVVIAQGVVGRSVASAHAVAPPPRKVSTNPALVHAHMPLISFSVDGEPGHGDGGSDSVLLNRGVVGKSVGAANASTGRAVGAVIVPPVSFAASLSGSVASSTLSSSSGPDQGGSLPDSTRSIPSSRARDPAPLSTNAPSRQNSMLVFGALADSPPGPGRGVPVLSITDENGEGVSDLLLPGPASGQDQEDRAEARERTDGKAGGWRS
ncbi:hypothetical protein HDU93_001297 [Gonapodya sp. JEL0774]|nr:hypothetical protein HDU93_001297 [Gonapodya sp. JEL0774]